MFDDSNRFGQENGAILISQLIPYIFSNRPVSGRVSRTEEGEERIVLGTPACNYNIRNERVSVSISYSQLTIYRCLLISARVTPFHLVRWHILNLCNCNLDREKNLRRVLTLLQRSSKNGRRSNL
jgi:hypothetical protein